VDGLAETCYRFGHTLQLKWVGIAKWLAVQKGARFAWFGNAPVAEDLHNQRWQVGKSGKNCLGRPIGYLPAFGCEGQVSNLQSQTGDKDGRLETRDQSTVY
jgi:hypothetical protein